MTQLKQIKVLIVEDSAVVREQIRHILESDPGIKVAGLAPTGTEAVRLVQELKPDCVTMDINMPEMNGLDATRMIMETHPVPIIIVSASYNRTDVEKSFNAMEAGAIAIAEKPFGVDHPDHESTAKELIQTVKLMSEVKVVKRWPRGRYPAVPVSIPQLSDIRPERHGGRIRAVVIGSSTGGPPVLQTILAGLRKGFPVPIVVVQHIAKGFLEGMVEWLRQTTHHPVHVALEGEKIVPGHVYFAPDDFHVGFANQGRIALSRSEPENGIRPSVSYLFRSALKVFGPDAAGVLLTGMGKDGADELKQLREQGALTIVQDRESSVVYGMPGEAVMLDAAMYVLPPEKIALALEGIFELNMAGDISERTRPVS